MKELLLRVSQEQTSRIFVGQELAPRIGEYIAASETENILYVTQTPLVKLLNDYLRPAKDDVLVLPPGEDQKNLESTVAILKKLAARQADKNTTLVVAFGGGVVSDLAGFAASIYKRGLPVIYIPTSLLAMVDASIGGKNGVNFEGEKNVLGTIQNPEAIFTDVDLLKNLPGEEFKSGLGELAKIAICLDTRLLRLLEKSPADNLEEIIALGMADKIKLVESDPYEKTGKRYMINFGHTLGHALESASGYRLKHGYAVAIGCNFAAFVSKEKGYISDDDYREVRDLIVGLGLPLSIDFDIKETMKHMKADKKKLSADRINFVLIKSIGEGCVEALDFKEVEKYLTVFQDTET